MTVKDIRWIQRFSHFQKAFLQLEATAGIVFSILHEYAQEFRTIRAKLQKMRSEAQS